MNYHGDQVVIKKAGAYLLDDRIIVHSNVIYKSGLAIASEPVLTAMIHDEPLEIGKLLLMALSSAETNVSDPDKYEGNIKPVLNVAGVRSNKELQEQAMYCVIEQYEAGYIITPTHNGGTRGNSKGFQFLPVEAFRLSSTCKQDELGTSLLKAFKKCTSIYD
jgi:hypothetical protein